MAIVPVNTVSNKDPILANWGQKSGQLTQVDGRRANLGGGGAGSEAMPDSSH